MRKRFTALLLSLLMVLTLMPATVFAEESYTLTYGGRSDGIESGYIIVYVDGEREASLYTGESLDISPGSQVEIELMGSLSSTLFDGWDVEGTDPAQISDAKEITFTMPEGNVKLTAKVQTLEDPKASIDDNGILTWNAVEGWESAAWVYKDVGGIISYLFESERKTAENGKYTYDLKAALQQYEAANGSLGSAEVVIKTAYWKPSDSADSGIRGQWENALTYNYSGAQKLETPTNPRWDGFTARWDTVEHAVKYKVMIYNKGVYIKTVTVTDPAFDLNQISDRLTSGETYNFKVAAIPEDSSTEYAESDFSSRSSDSAPYQLPGEPVDYNLVVGGVVVTSENAADIFGDRKVSYDPNTKVLTLNNAVLNSGIYRSSIVDGDDLTVNVAGENTINITDTYGIALGANALYLQGSGTLEITETGDMGQQGIWAKKITIDGVTLSINCGSSGIYAEAVYGVSVEEGDETVNIINGAELDIISSQSAAITAKGKISLDGSTVTAETTDTSSNALYSWDGSIKIKNSTVKVYGEVSESPAIWAATDIEISGGSEVTVTGGSSNTVYSDGDILIDDSTANITDSSEYAYPALYAYGNINITNGSDVTAKSKGMRGIFTDGDMDITDSTVTAVGTTNEGMVVVGTLNVTNSKLTATSLNAADYTSAIYTERLNVTASDVTAHGGIDLCDLYDTGDTAWDDISFSITPASGKLAELKVDRVNRDGSNAIHFRQDTESPYDGAVIFSTDEMNRITTNVYIHIGEHIHTGGTAACTESAVCDDCGRTYGAPGEHALTEHTCKAPTCTTPGKAAYFTCETCGKHFEDKAGKTEITNLDSYGIIPATGHEAGTAWESDGNGHWNKCVNCGDKMNEAAHTYEWVTDKEATAAEAGSKHEECTVCGYAKAAIEIPATGTTEEPSEPSGPDETPSESEPPKDTPDTGVSSPQTGDNSKLTLWFVLLSATGAFTATVLIYGRRKKREH